MKYIGISIGIFLASMFSQSFATVGGQYAVNVHFVPPLVNAQCSIAQFWSPPNVTCALCFCMTGSLSRCIPQPGCNPQNSTTTVAPETTEPASTDSSGAPATMPGASTNPTPAANPAPTTSAPEGGMSSDSSPGTGTDAPPVEMQSPPAEGPAPPAESEGSKRGAKPGKPRRRRHSFQY